MVAEVGPRSVVWVTARAHPPLFERIVVGVDGRDGGRDALALAVLLSRIDGAELFAVRVRPYERNVDLAHPRGDDDQRAARLRAELEHDLLRLGVRAQPIVATESSPGMALHGIAARHDALLIVVGASHRAGSERLIAGDNAIGTLHGARCAVAIAPRGFASAADGLHEIGVGFDCSHEARAALELARVIAHRVGARVQATMVATAAENAAAARSMADGLLHDREDGEVALNVAVGTPWKVLAARSANLDLLVIGSRAHGPVQRLLLGSTSTRLAREATCPLLVLPVAHRRARVLTPAGQRADRATPAGRR
jgi:nucleotide-binding universal stress UspA family protein